MLKFAKPFTICAAIGALALFALVGCAGNAPSPSSGSGEPVKLDNEGVMMVPLDYSAGTGFGWQCELSGDKDALFIADEYDEDLAKDEHIDGGPLRHWVTLRASAPGSATLTCNLVRPWEDGEPAETQVYVFDVNADLQILFEAEHSTYTHEPERAYNS